MSDYRLIALGPEPERAAAVTILAHGRGGSPEDMRRLALALDIPEMCFLMPGAPGGTWYPQSFMAPFELNEPDQSRSLANHARLIDSVIALGVPAERIALGGFSQGACLTAETLVRHPMRYGAALILTGGLIGPPGTRWPARPALSGTPVYLTGSKIDQHVPVSRTLETERVLKQSGAVVETRIFDDRPHMVSEEEIVQARAYLRRLAEGTGADETTGGRVAGMGRPR
jgi:phospholipase/carboxylesterase